MSGMGVNTGKKGIEIILIPIPECNIIQLRLSTSSEIIVYNTMDQLQNLQGNASHLFLCTSIFYPSPSKSVGKCLFEDHSHLFSMTPKMREIAFLQKHNKFVKSLNSIIILVFNQKFRFAYLFHNNLMTKRFFFFFFFCFFFFVKMIFTGVTENELIQSSNYILTTHKKNYILTTQIHYICNNLSNTTIVLPKEKQKKGKKRMAGIVFTQPSIAWYRRQILIGRSPLS